jgi:hypothetical protein
VCVGYQKSYPLGYLEGQGEPVATSLDRIHAWVMRQLAAHAPAGSGHAA